MVVYLKKNLGPIYKSMQLVKHHARKADYSRNVAALYKHPSSKGLTLYCIAPLTVGYALTCIYKYSYIYT